MRILVAICVLVVGARAQFTKTGIIYPTGKNVQFTHEQAENIVHIGPGDFVTRDGKHIQLDRDGLPVVKRSTRRGEYGESGIVYPDGSNVQFTREEADNIVSIGPSGVVKKDGNNVQLTRLGVPRVRRHLEGPSGLITKDGQVVHLGPGVYVVLKTSSGVVLSNGKNIQLS